MDEECSRRSLLLTFDSDDPEFVRGVEVGRLWERLSTEPEVVVETMHTSNAEMVIRIAESLGYRFSGEMVLSDGSWMVVCLYREPRVMSRRGST